MSYNTVLAQQGKPQDVSGASLYRLIKLESPNKVEWATDGTHIFKLGTVSNSMGVKDVLGMYMFGRVGWKDVPLMVRNCFNNLSPVAGCLLASNIFCRKKLATDIHTFM